MSTRAAIARPSADGFAGRYHHWDGYPTALGKTLWDALQTTGAKPLCEFLIDAHPAGWSTINNKNLTLEPGFVDSFEYDCATCDRPAWKHYIQNYGSRGLKQPKPFTPGTYLRYDHAAAMPEKDPSTQRPECYCHGGRAEQPWLVTHENASGSGVEFVYVIDEKSDTFTVMETRTDGNDSHMVGMFGVGDERGTFRILWTGKITGPEPDWVKLNKRAGFAE